MVPSIYIALYLLVVTEVGQENRPIKVIKGSASGTPKNMSVKDLY